MALERDGVQENIKKLLAMGDDALSLGDKLYVINRLRNELGLEIADEILVQLIEQKQKSLEGLKEQLETAGGSIKKLEEIIAQITAPPLNPAIFIGLVEVYQGQGMQAEVIEGSRRSIVSIHPDIDLSGLVIGHEVFLTAQKNCIIALSPFGIPKHGEIVEYLRKEGEGGQILVKHRDEEIICDQAQELRETGLKEGDNLLCHVARRMVFRKVEKMKKGDRYNREDVPEVSRDQVGGRHKATDELERILILPLLYPEQARQSGIRFGTNILLYGPPGTGKTLRCQYLANRISSATGKKCRLKVVRPSEFESKWFGETQKRVRECWDSAREEARENPVIIILDEVDSIGRTRGQSLSAAADKETNAILAELDGFDRHENIAVIATTNRLDILDEGFLSRFRHRIEIGRPTLDDAKDIISIHLPESGFAKSGSLTRSENRSQIVEMAVTILFSPNCPNELCRLQFNDGSTRTARASDCISGRMLADICANAMSLEFNRKINGDMPGIIMEDMELAVMDAISKLREEITEKNVHKYLSDLPLDLMVIKVEKIESRIESEQELLILNVA